MKLRRLPLVFAIFCIAFFAACATVSPAQPEQIIEGIYMLTYMTVDGGELDFADEDSLFDFYIAIMARNTKAAMQVNLPMFDFDCLGDLTVIFRQFDFDGIHSADEFWAAFAGTMFSDYEMDEILSGLADLGVAHYLTVEDDEMSFEIKLLDDAEMRSSAFIVQNGIFSFEDAGQLGLEEYTVTYEGGIITMALEENGSQKVLIYNLI